MINRQQQQQSEAPESTSLTVRAELSLCLWREGGREGGRRGTYIHMNGVRKKRNVATTPEGGGGYDMGRREEAEKRARRRGGGH